MFSRHAFSFYLFIDTPRETIRSLTAETSNSYANEAIKRFQPYSPCQIRYTAQASNQSQLTFCLLPSELVSSILITATQLVPIHQVALVTESAMLVCKLWHRIVLHTPGLWNTIFIEKGHQMARLAVCLTRSGDLPLTIKMYFASISNELINALVLQAHRWYSLDLCVDHTTMQTIFDSAPTTLASLTSLSLQYYTYKFGDSRQLLALNPYCPSLTQLQVEGIQIDWASWSRLESIRYFAINKNFLVPSLYNEGTFTNISTALAQCRELVSLEFSSTSVPTGTLVTQQPIIMPCLSHLTIDFHGISTPETSPYSVFLTAYTFPHLTHLHIQGPGFAPRKGAHQVEIRIPSLTNLDVKHLVSLDYLMSHFLAFSPNLVSLHIGSENHRMLELTNGLHVGGSSMCPKLASLETLGLTIDALHDIVSGRQGVLQSLVVHAKDIDLTLYDAVRLPTLTSKLSDIRQWTRVQTYGV